MVGGKVLVQGQIMKKNANLESMEAIGTTNMNMWKGFIQRNWFVSGYNKQETCLANGNRIKDFLKLHTENLSSCVDAIQI